MKYASDPRTEALFNEITSSAKTDWSSMQCRWGSVANGTIILGIFIQLFVFGFIILFDPLNYLRLDCGFYILSNPPKSRERLQVSDESHTHCASRHSIQCEILYLLGSYIALAQILKAKKDIALLPFPPETSKTVTAAPTVAFPGLKAYTNFPALTRSINPGFPFVETKFLTILPEAGSISTRWFTATSVTKAVPVSAEKAAQQVAF